MVAHGSLIMHTTDSLTLFTTQDCRATARYARSVWHGPYRTQLRRGLDSHVYLTELQYTCTLQPPRTKIFHRSIQLSVHQVVANRASNTPDPSTGTPLRGDDFFAFVGYASDGDPVHHCTAIGNWGRHGHARGLSAVVSQLSALQL